MNFIFITLICVLVFCKTISSISLRGKDWKDKVLINRPKSELSEKLFNEEHIRRKRYLGLSKRFKLNRRYQECVALGDAKGHCKHINFCPLNILGTARNVLDYLCVIERAHVGVCCPDDIAVSGLSGSHLIMDLPGGGYDYEENDNTTGCGIPAEGRSIRKDKLTSNATSIQEWPWLAALYKPQELNRGTGQQFCGGAIITDRHILTASHCTYGLKAQDIAVRLGEYDFRRFGETRAADYEVEEIIQHEEYVHARYENDIAILILKKPTSFNSYVWPICLPPVQGSYDDQIAIVAGWGQKYYKGPVSPVLLQVEVPVWPDEKCKEAFLESVNENNLCAAAYEGGKDSCVGDSGGPLNYQLENGRWVTIGIVSWGIGCADKGRPGVYTRVSNYLPWIIKNTIAKK